MSGGLEAKGTITTETLRAQKELSVISESLWFDLGVGCGSLDLAQLFHQNAVHAFEKLTTETGMAATEAGLHALEISPQRRRGHGDISVLSVSLW